jgi:Fur family peroxide stress response transcriptional regulator
LEYLDENKSHPSADDIYTEIRKKFPMMSFATVYNTIETLKKKGYLVELTIDPERRHYDPDISPHHHLICKKCKKIVDIHRDFSVNIPEDQKGAFEVLGNHIEFYGVCQKCKTKGE